MALGTPVAAAAAYSAASGTSVSPAYPAGILATDDVLLFVGQKPTAVAGGTVTTPAGWTLRDELTNAGGYAAQGADTGNSNLRVYTWDTPVAGQTGNLAVTIGGNDVTWAFIVRIPGGGSYSYGSADGQRTTTPTSPMAIALTNGASATAFATGDIAIWAMVIPTDVTTPAQFSAQSITATGATFNTALELNEPDSGTGNDIGGYSAWARVTAGSSSTAPTVTATLAGTLTNVRGPVVLLRVRDTSQALSPTPYTNTQTFFAPTVTSAVELTPDPYTNDQTFYSPDVTQAGGGQSLTPDLYTNTQAFFAPTVTASNELTPDLYTNAQSDFAPTVSTSYTLTPNLTSNSPAFYSPTASATNTLAPSLYSNGQTFYAPLAAQSGGPQTLLPALYTNDQTVYGAALTATNALAPGLYSNAQAFYSPALDSANLLTPAPYVNAPVFYAPTVGQGGTTQALVCNDYAEGGYVEAGYVAWPGFNAQTFFAATVAGRFPGFEVDMEPATWWTRKPKAEPPEQAREKLQAVAKVVSETAQAHVAERASRAWRKAAVRARIEPLIQEMPGFDWVTMYDRAYSTLLSLEIRRRMDEADRLARQEIDRIRARDEDDVVALLMSL